MPNVLADIATLVADALNNAPAGTFSQSFGAVRSYADWELPLEESPTGNEALRVDVVPVPALESELESRGAISYSPATDIIVRKRLGQDARGVDGKLLLAEVDALVLFVQELAEFFTADQMDAETGARWKQTDIRRAYVPSHLKERHQFTGQIRVTFDVSTAL